MRTTFNGGSIQEARAATAAIALLCVTLGYKLLPAFMRMMGKHMR